MDWKRHDLRLLGDTAEKYVIWATTAIALVARLVFVLWIHPVESNLFSDMGVYDMRADHLLHGSLGPWDTFTPIGYPAFLAAIYGLLGKNYTIIGVLQALMGAATAWLTNRVAKVVSGSNTTAFASGLAVALYFPLVYYAGHLLTESLTAFLLVLFAWALLRAAEASSLRTAGAAIVLAVAITVRPNVVLVCPLLLAWAFVRYQGDRRRAYGLWLKIIGFATPLLLLVSVHNSLIRHRPTGLATNGGINFYLARAEASGAVFQEGDALHRIAPIPNLMWYTKPFVSPVPFYDEGYFYRLGVQDLVSRPFGLIASLRNLSEGFGLGKQGFWPDWQSREPMHVFFKRAILLAIVPAFSSMALLLWRSRLFASEEHGRFLLFAFCLSCVVALYAFLGDPRVRIPYDPFFLILGADAWVLAARGIKRVRRARVTSAG